MEHRKRIVPVVLLLVLILSAYLYSTGNLPLISRAGAEANTASGFIEGEEVAITAEVGGRIQALDAEEGSTVQAGQEIVRLDRALLDAQMAQAQAAVDTARAQLALVRNGARPSEVTAARTALEAARLNFDKVRNGGAASDRAAAQAAREAALKNFDKVRAGPTVDQIAQLKTQVDNTQAAVEQARTAYDRVGGASNPNIGMLPQSLALQQAENYAKAAAAAYNDALTHPTASELAAAQAQVEQAQAALARLTADAAQLAAAQAQVDQAQAALDRLTPTAEAVAVAENQVKQAEAALAILRVQSAKMTLKGPVNGVVTRRTVHAGEMAAPDAPLLTLVTLDPVKLTIYVPETQIGTVKLGDEFGVTVDSFPDKVFKGKVIYIASQAEFTPRNVQTKTERVNTVFAVKLQIPNPKQELKPGMPADAALR